VNDVVETPSPADRREPPAWHWGTREKLLARIEHKRGVVLAWLGTEIFSTARVLGQVLGLKKTGTHQTLAAMKRDGLIDFQSIEWHAASLQIVVLTPHGAALAGDGGDGYQQGKVAPSSIGHQLDVQQARFYLERTGWSEWVAERTLREEAGTEERDDSLPVLKRRWLKVPDGVGLSPRGLRVGVEMERSIKTTKSYTTIVGQYLQMLERGVVDRVLYVTTSDRVRDALHSKVSALEIVNFPDGVRKVNNRRQVATKRRAFENDEKAKFLFASMDDLRANRPPRDASETADEYRQRVERQQQ
jgi:hypothetical protein